ncbi:MAG: DUF1385 domain-containing protein [Firmicutes bacterium]|nr:DUF1385 domain-containing protein [Bacillota bacterium]
MTIGGQAVLEGVMLRSKTHQSLAVRVSDGSIHREVTRLRPLSSRSRFFRLPLVRGVVALIDSLSGAVGCLGRSAQLLEPEAEISNRDLAITVILALTLGIGLFFVVPILLAAPAANWLGLNRLGINFLEGLVRISLFLAYIVLISRARDIQRTFEYHGAEHKVIHCWEKGQDLTVEHAQACSRLHPRCGTSFLLLVVLISILVFAVFSPTALGYKVLLRLLLLPLVAGLAFEVIRLSQRSNFFLVRALTAPGLMMQRLTTREPDATQVEVALAALETVIDPESVGRYNKPDTIE